MVLKCFATLSPTKQSSTTPLHTYDNVTKLEYILLNIFFVKKGNSNLNSSNFQISTNSGLGANVDVFIANTSGVPYANSATTTQLSMGFLSGTANYVATGQRLGALQFFGQ